MSQEKICRLCVNSCTEYKRLYDENGRYNDVYEFTRNYFHPEILNMNEYKHFEVVCLQCWQPICDFHNFQLSISLIQLQLIGGNKDVIKIEEDDAAMETDGIGPDLQETPVVKLEENILSIDLQCDQVNSCQEMEEIFENVEDLLPNDFQESEELDIGEDRNILKRYSYIPNKVEPISVPKLCESSIERNPLEECSAFNTPPQTPVKNSLIKEPIFPVPAIKSPQLSVTKRSTKKFSKISQELDEFVSLHERNIKCVLCLKLFPKLSLLQKHFTVSHPGEQFFFRCCHSKLDRYCLVEDHILQHLDASTFRCEVCRKLYSSRFLLEKHMKRLHPQTEAHKYVCKPCGRGFATIQGRFDHFQSVHVTFKRYFPRYHGEDEVDYAVNTCEECGRALVGLRDFKEHLWYIHRIKSVNTRSVICYACAYCPKVFKCILSVFRHWKGEHPQTKRGKFFQEFRMLQKAHKSLK